MTRKKRRFELADLIFLVVACAIAFAICMGLKQHSDALGANWSPGNTITFVWATAGFCLVTLTMYLAAMVLRRKPSRQDLISSWGDVTVVSISLVALIHVPTNWDLLFGTPIPLERMILLLPFSLAGEPLAGAAVAVSCWLVLFLASPERAESDWLDLSGRLTAYTWLLFAFAEPVVDLRVLDAWGVSFE